MAKGTGGTADGHGDGTADRQAWMGLLARAEPEFLSNCWRALVAREPKLALARRDPPGAATSAQANEAVGGAGYRLVRGPEVGLIMARGRAGGTGTAFNFGEVSVTRCTVRLDDGVLGHAYVSGRDKAKAELAALLDAQLQRAQYRERIDAEILSPLRANEEARRANLARKRAATKVDFFTMVRSES